ncbi:MAG TPA: alpha/beta hydrolase [Leptolyngbyaceae cyanobacterium M33_DOE_097]|uniref:Alpha/beta hydrolase n=1 Tax=Oscillatoriales cyanobacterium SpSt-418 TaxID=2282169 RepID=A0A7C3PGH1_9CYAN|nr:alpha/beta hydrolase [Leptolyngbyaceae cyanobacterium M33_DOE_097]
MVVTHSFLRRKIASLKQLSRFSLPHAFAFGLLVALVAALPGKAAEKIYFRYGPFINSLQVSSLESFAKTGQVNADLRHYFRLARADSATQQRFRELLVKRLELQPFAVSQFFNSELGYDILDRLGQYLQTPTWSNGRQSLRAGIVLAAFDPEGFTLLNFFQKLPVNLHIDVAASLEGFRTLERVVQATVFFTQKMESFSSQESASVAVDFAQLPDLRQPGPFSVQEQRWVLKDTTRDRQLYVLVYQPSKRVAGKTPVLLLSHGLGSRPEDFADRAKHLASYGFLVALPQHPGSDAEQVQRLKKGLSRHYFLTSEFIDRPKDLSFVLDELERRNQAEFDGQLNLQSVGVGGHSFGGYGVLAAAGATIDFEFLQQQCDRRFGHLNTSLLLQCRALQLPRKTYNFRDPRVKAVLAANPVNYAIFGPKGLGQVTVPVFMIGGSDDPATPVVFEQAQSFPLLKSPVKYLALAEGQAHVNLANLDTGVTYALNSIEGLYLASPYLLQTYADAMFVAFFQADLIQDANYKPYMHSAYAEYLSRDEKFKLFVISEASENALNLAIAEFRSKR